VSESARGIPFVSVVGTPRIMGTSTGTRLKSTIRALRLQTAAMLGQAAGDDRLSIRRAHMLDSAHEPGLALELEAMATAAEVSLDDLLLVHGYSDLLSFYHAPQPVSPSTYLTIPPERTHNHEPCMALIWQVDPALLRHLVLVHRIPAHGPSSLSLTLGGVHPVAGVSEAGIAVASNELRVADGQAGHFTSHILATILGAPSFDDALARSEAGPRFGGRAISVLDADAARYTCELTGQLTATLPEQSQSMARVHTNHLLDRELLKTGVVTHDIASVERLAKIARLVSIAHAVHPSDIASWFGFAQQIAVAGASTGAKMHDPNESVVVIMEPKARTLHIGIGSKKHHLDTFKL
jgi:hypothetical protein